MTSLPKLFLICGFICLVFFLAIPVQAQGLVPCGTSANPKPCTVCDLLTLGQNLEKFLIGRIVPLLGGTLFVIGGFLYLLAGVDPKYASQGRNIMTTTAYGVAIILGAYMLTNTILVSLAGKENTGSWYTITCSTTVNPETGGISGTTSVGSGSPTGGNPTGGPTGGECSRTFGNVRSGGCSNISQCVNVNSLFAAHGCESNGGQCLLSSGARDKAQKLVSSFASLSGGKCSLRIASALQGPSGPSESSCHKPGNPQSGTCADINITNGSYSDCKDAFYKAAEQAGVYSFLDEYCKPVSTTTGGNIHVNF